MTQFRKTIRKIKKEFAKLTNDELTKEHTYALQLQLEGNKQAKIFLYIIELELKKRGITDYKL